MLKRLSVSHYKSLESISVDFRKTNVIVGQNGAGKSNIIDAISFFSDIVHEDLDSAVMKRHGIESIRQWSKFRPFDISLELDFDTATGSGKYGFTLKSGKGGSYSVSEEHGEWHGSDPFQADLPLVYSSFNRTKDGSVSFDLGVIIAEKKYDAKNIQISPFDLYLTSISNTTYTVEGIVFSKIKDELSNLISYSIYPNTLREPRVVSRDSRLLADGSNLPTVLRKMTGPHKNSRDSVVEALSTLLPHLNGIQVKSAGGYYVPVLEGIGGNGEQHQFNLSQVSDGTLRMLGLLTALYQPDRPNMIAVEEPEQMIHPGALPILAEAMAEFVSGRGAGQRQIFLPTHSPNLIDLFQPEDIIWTNSSNGVTQCGRVDDRQLDILRKRLFTTGELFLSEGFFYS